MKIGESIRRLRRERGLTQEELALELDTAASTVSRIENDERTPSLDMLVRLAQSLQVSVGDLFAHVPAAPANPAAPGTAPLALETGGDDDDTALRRYYLALTPDNQRLALDLLKALVRHQHRS